MILIVSIDENGGMAFNHRRQTRDKKQREYLNNILGGKTVYMSNYTAKLFVPDFPDVNCIVDDNYLTKAGETDFVICELDDLSVFYDKIDKLILFKWNRNYPFDVVFPKKITEKLKKTETKEFKGYSHDLITVEVFE